jgi:predicted TIM-barrel fold metal-dependent hydrolase
MESCNVRAIVNLDGRWQGELEANLDRYDRRYPERFFTFCHVDWALLRGQRPEEALARAFEESLLSGARGLKVWKDLGLKVRDGDDRLVMPDDPRLGPLWETAARFGVPVAIHTADPPAFFDAVDERNERLEELLAHPEWSYANPAYPSFHRLIQALEATVARNPHTTFIGVHVGCFAEDLAWVGRMLESYQNFHIDLSARLAEIGRQPRSIRAMILRHPDRILFGTDGIPPSRHIYERYFRFLETSDESFPYSCADPPPNGRWTISAIDLPSQILGLLYANNARRLIRINECKCAACGRRASRR